MWAQDQLHFNKNSTQKNFRSGALRWEGIRTRERSEVSTQYPDPMLQSSPELTFLKMLSRKGAIPDTRFKPTLPPLTGN